jgi:hypothetical protein
MVRCLDPQLKRQNRQTIYIRRAATTRSDYGAPSFGTARKICVRFCTDRDIVETTLGRQVVSGHAFVSTTEIKKTDAIFLPGDDPTDDSLIRHPQDIQLGVDEFGDTHFWLVMF